MITVLHSDGWRPVYQCVVAWVFDSFWVEHIPRVARYRSLFDHVFVTENEDLEVWQDTVKAPVSWLPWGSDVLELGGVGRDKDIDLLRVGRQPPEWNDDNMVSRACAARGIRFHGRPPSLASPIESHKSLMAMFQRARFTLSFSNLVNPEPYTHSYREYITGRWVDALACGAIVAGVPPKSESVRELLWDDALLKLTGTDLQTGVESIRDALNAWTSVRARRNWLHALERLDWRWRLRMIANECGLSAPTLDAELGIIRSLLAPSESQLPLTVRS